VVLNATASRLRKKNVEYMYTDFLNGLTFW
jgi:hypothetical protein